MPDTRLQSSARRTSALLVLVGLLQLVFSSFLHGLSSETDEVHVWCPEHQRLEHRHASVPAAAAAAGANNRFLDRQRPQDDHHAVCPLFILVNIDWAKRGVQWAIQANLADETPRPAPFAPRPALAVIVIAPKTSPPESC